ncbi:MAG: hypothetical protein ACJ8F1_16185 [Polyangia bacterium]
MALSGGGIAVNCSKGSSNPGGTGKVSLAFALPSGASITDVAYDIHAGAPTGIADVTGHVNTTDKNATPSVEHSFPASTGDTVTLDATTSSGVSCHGVSMPFDVTAGGTARVSVTLVCGAATNPAGSGSVIVNSTIVEGNACPYLTSWVASPLQTSVGGTIDVGAAAADLSTPADTLTYAWTPAANFTAPTTGTTQYHCTAAGVHTITLTVADNHGTSPCTAAINIDVTCVAVSVCGNGMTEVGEQCDPPNGTTCDSNCQTIVTATGGSTGTAGAAGSAAGASGTGGAAGAAGASATGGTAGTGAGGTVATGGVGGGVAGNMGTGGQPQACTVCETNATADGTCFNTSVDGTTNGCDGFTGTQRDACYALVSCIRTGNGAGKSCANLDDPTPCLCGTLTATACGQSDPTTLPGACRAQYIAANGGTGTGLFGAFFATGSPVGIANNMFTCDIDMATDTGLSCPSSVCGIH